LATPAQAISNNLLQLLTGGIALFGIGEWKNHKEETTFKKANAYTGPATYFTYTVRKPDIFGLLMEIIGFAMIVYSIILIVRA